MPQNVVLPGPAPWGFRLSGGIDFNQPLVITRVCAFHPSAASRGLWRAAGPLGGGERPVSHWGVLGGSWLRVHRSRDGSISANKVQRMRSGLKN